jgi:hypothetical protein
MQMSVSEFLHGFGFSPGTETRRLIGVAFEMACAARHLRELDETSRLMVARKIIEIAKAGELNPDRLCERALAQIDTGDPRPGFGI